MNTGKDLGEAYDKLELAIIEKLVELIEKFGQDSKHREGKALTVNIFDATELMYDFGLFFLDSNGDVHSIDADCTLIDLIDIINQYDDGN